jgi:ATP-dependent DNA ligase
MMRTVLAMTVAGSISAAISGISQAAPIAQLPAAGESVYRHACALGCEGIVSKWLGSPYRAGRVVHWLKLKNPDAPAVKREAEEEWR